MPLKYDWIALEADTFKQTLDRTVVFIHSAAYEALASALEKQLESLAGWSEEGAGISAGQYEDYVREEWTIQVRALATMTFTLMGTQLMGFLKKANGAFLDRHFPRTKERYGKSKDGEFLQVVAEYDERYGIKIEGLPGFEAGVKHFTVENAKGGTRCFYVTRVDGLRSDFSFMKCLRG